jgi:aminoglycoside phosphotransferase (APT) family kinase protein
MAHRMPAAEVEIDAALVRGLLADQHPDLAALPLEAHAPGWDNAIYRLGRERVVRLPRRALAARLVAHEQRWLPELAPRLPLPIPAPVRVGRPGRGFPWAWSVCPWFEGETAADAPLDPEPAARHLGAFVAALHAPAPDDAPANELRGGPLAGRTAMLEERVALLGDAIDGEAVLAGWRRALDAPRAGRRVWLHGDLHPANLVVQGGRLAAVLDFGDLTGGDPATDLAVGWMLFDADSRPVFRAAAGGAEEATWARARGWALSHAIACLASSADNPRMHAVGARTLAHVLADAD